MPLPPPPYTRVPLKDRGTLDPETIKLRLLRALIDSIAVTSQVDHKDLREASSDTSLVAADSPVMSETRRIIRRSILSQDERNETLYLAVLVRNTAGIFQPTLESITSNEKRLIYHHIYVPASEPDVPQHYVVHLLRLYTKHKGVDHQKATRFVPVDMPWMM
jgi:hypothetical protein